MTLSVVVRSRLQEFYQRVIREEMLTLFNHTVKISQLECSIVLGGSMAIHEETKYRAAAILEILTGQRVKGISCDLVQEDPLQRAMSEAQKRELDKARGDFVRQTLNKGNNKKNVKLDPSLVTAQFRKMGSGMKLVSTLHGNDIFFFLEKLREFYLPDVIGTSQEDDKHKWKPPTSGHGNNHARKGLVLHFQKYGGSKRPCYPSRYPVNETENPREAITCYTLKTSDLLKFPDIELHFEALSAALGGARAESTGQSLQLILRPTLEVETPLKKTELRKVPQVDTIKMMNYLLSQFFNGYLNRPHIGGEYKMEAN